MTHINASEQMDVGQTYIKLPILIKAIVLFTLVSTLIPGSILGFNLTGISWVVPFVFSVVILTKRVAMTSFPTMIWVPWILVLTLHFVCDDKYVLLDTVSPFQRILQLLTPIVIGMATSTYRPTIYTIRRFVSVLRVMAYVLIVGSIMLAFEQIRKNEPTGLAPQAITALLLAIVFANRFVFFKKAKDLMITFLLGGLSLIALTRTVIAVMLVIFPTSFAPLSFIKRVLATLMISMVGVWVFYLPQVQHKMFYSGYGELTDVFTKEDFAMTGRARLWQILFSEAQNKYWLGHGIGAAETASRRLADLSYPHNDWLLTYYDLGLLGVVIFLLCNILMVKHGYSASKKSHQTDLKFLFCAGISMFLPFMLVMWTDNVMVYSSFFGNLHFCILGFAYGALRRERGM